VGVGSLTGLKAALGGRGEAMNRDEALKLLRGGRQGIRKWNQWCKSAEDIPSLSGADFSEARLTSVRLTSAGLTSAGRISSELTSSGRTSAKPNSSGPT
jgi:hypothetical protein